MTTENKKDDGKKWNSFCIKANCIRNMAWILLTLGFCVIAFVIYLALHYTEACITDNISSNHTDEYNVNVIGLDGNLSVVFNMFPRNIEGTIKTQGCREFNCRIDCSQNGDSLYEDVSLTLNESVCTVTTSLTLKNIKMDAISNSWHVSNRTVHQITLMSLRLGHIQSGAFNAPMFSSTFVMYWHDIELNTLDAGTLLGLYALRYLKITTTLPHWNFAFLQPVQTTLSHFILNADLNFEDNTNFFGNIYFRKLEYLDLSRNNFEGALTNHMFHATPNLKYLYIRHANIKAIDPEIFENFAGKLHVLNLAYNQLIELNADTLRPLLNGTSITYLELEPNNLCCDCSLLPLVKLYKQHSNQFMTTLFCKWPYHLYGISLDQLTEKQLNCDENIITDLSSSDKSTQTETGFKMSVLCMGSPFEQQTSPIQKSLNEDVREESHKGSDYLIFEPPDYDLILTLFPNNTVCAKIVDFFPTDKMNIIWFSEHFDAGGPNSNNGVQDYNCMLYTEPYLVINDLNLNTTYTFCMVRNNQEKVSPFNCQPLHVPADSEIIEMTDEENIQVIENEKQFTIGIICLIFFISALIGAVIAYLGIKTYPDLLEGSKNVLVVKKSDKTCYVSTITEAHQLKNSSSIRKRPLSGSFKCIIKPPDLYTKKSEVCDKNIRRLSSVKSSSTCFDESFSTVSYCQYIEDDYETPMTLEESFYSVQPCVQNNYTTSPSSLPPPLPKRNMDF